MISIAGPEILDATSLTAQLTTAIAAVVALYPGMKIGVDVQIHAESIRQPRKRRRPINVL